MKWANELNRTFSKEDIQMAKKHKKKCSPPLALKEKQIKNILRFYLTLFRLAIISNTTEVAGKKEPFYIAGGNATSTTILEKNLEAS
jgi:hypothetical protein